VDTTYRDTGLFSQSQMTEITQAIGRNRFSWRFILKWCSKTTELQLMIWICVAALDNKPCFHYYHYMMVLQSRVPMWARLELLTWSACHDKMWSQWCAAHWGSPHNPRVSS